MIHHKSNLSFQVGAEILSLLLLYADLMFLHVQQMLKLTNPFLLLFGFLRLSFPVN